MIILCSLRNFQRKKKMITIEQFLNLIDFRVGLSNEFLWKCYGDRAQILDSSDEKFSMIYDTMTQQVFEVKVYDYKNSRAYRMIHPDYVDAYKKEAEIRGVPSAQAWDDVDYIDLDLVEDWLEKAQAIAAGQDYDTRVKIPLDLPESDLFKLMKLAHEKDITLNQLVEHVISNEISRLSNTK